MRKQIKQHRFPYLIEAVLGTLISVAMIIFPLIPARAAEVVAKGPTFREDVSGVYIPADSGVRYHIYQYSSGERQELKWPGTDYPYSKPGLYKKDQGLDVEKLVVVTATSAGSSTTLAGTVAWAYLFKSVSKKVTFVDNTGSVEIPSIEGVQFTLNGKPVSPGVVPARQGEKNEVKASATVEEAKGIEVFHATHTFPKIVTPVAPTFDDSAQTVYIPSGWGVRYLISVEGKPVTKDGLDYSKPGTYSVDDGLVLGKEITVTAFSAGSASVISGTHTWTHTFAQVTDVTAKGPSFRDDVNGVYIPSDAGVRYHIYQYSSGERTEVTWPGTDYPYAKPGLYTAEQGLDASGLVEVVAQSAGSATQLTGTTTWAHLFPEVTKKIVFDDERSRVTVPTLTAVKFLLNGEEISGTTAQAMQRQKNVVTAVSTTDHTAGIKVAEVSHFFPAVITPTAPTFDDVKRTVYIPSGWGVRYLISVEGKPVTKDGLDYSKPGTYSVDDGLVLGKEITVTAFAAGSQGIVVGNLEWKHTLPDIPRTYPKGPSFDDLSISVYIPSDYGVRYLITVDGKKVTKEGLAYSKPGNYTEKDGIRLGKQVVVTASPASSSTVLGGTTQWTHTFNRPQSSLSHGDEFNDSSALPNVGWSIVNQSATKLRDNGGSVYSKRNIRVKDGNLEVITQRHCLKPGEDVSDDNVHPQPCPSGTRTVYSSGRIMSGFNYTGPFKMEVRSRMDPTNPVGMHYAVWTRNDQPYCNASITHSELSELDTMEVWGDKEENTNTSHITCKAGPHGEDWTNRDTHVHPAQITGVWNTYTMIWDGYSVSYYLNGKPMEWNGHQGRIYTTARWLGIGDDFYRAMNNHPFQLIVDNKVYGSGQWRAAPAKNKVFNTRVDKIDYVRITPLQSVYPLAGVESYFAARNWEDGWLGVPQQAEQNVAGGAYQRFEHGTVYWSSATGAHGVHNGMTLRKYEKLGGPSGELGFPTSEERNLRGGWSQSFEHGWQIHAHSGLSEAYSTHGGIQSYWSAQGWENGWLGYPVSEEIKTAGGAYQRFEHGTVYWSSATGAHGVHNGMTLRKYEKLGGPSGELGFPTSEERNLRGGWSQSFEHGWQIHAHSGLSEAYSTHGGIQSYWSAQGWENGWLGYPVSEEIKTAVGVIQYFEHGKVEWKNGTAYGSR